jgi:hypothetical protein
MDLSNRMCWEKQCCSPLLHTTVNPEAFVTEIGAGISPHWQASNSAADPSWVSSNVINFYHCLETVPDPTGWGSTPKTTQLHTQLKVRAFGTSVSPATNSSEWLTYWFIMKEILKGANGQPDAET